MLLSKIDDDSFANAKAMLPEFVEQHVEEG